MANDGKDFERIVQLIEQSISPDSVVEHDVDLPVIGSESKRTRQCDVVIRTGQKPRQTTTIVEVQERDSRVDITMFGGWVEKLKQVDAQHLICVSRHEFPTSVKEEAFKLGGTVRLVTLKALDAEDMPIHVVFDYKGFDVKELKKTTISTSKSEAEALGIRDDLTKILGDNRKLNASDVFWSVDKKNLISLFILCRDFFVRPEGTTEGEGRLIFDTEEGPELYLFAGGQYIRAGLDCVFLWENEEVQIPISILSYEQNEAGVLAWFAEISYESKRGVLSTKFPFVKTDEGYKVDRMLVTLPANVNLSVTVHRQQGTRPHEN